MIRKKLDLIDILDDIFAELDEQDMSEVTFKDIIDYIYRHRKDKQTEDDVTKLLLKKYLKELKESKNEVN